MISVNNIEVIFGKGTPLQKQALNGVSLTIEQGSFVTVIGSNGAGKSTLLGVLAGDVLPSAGQVTIGKTDVSRKGTAARAGLVARVFQDPLTGSCGALSIEENLALAAKRGEARGLTAALGPKRREHFRERIASSTSALKTAWATAWTFCPAASARRSRWSWRRSQAPKCCCSTSIRQPSTLAWPSS